MTRLLLPLSLSCVVAAFLLPAAATAQEPSVRAYLTPGGEVGVGRAFVLNLEITGTQTVGRDPVLPDLTDFAGFLGSSTQSAVRMVNGRTTVSLTIQYRYQALTEGTFAIPAFDVDVGGRTLTTQPLQVTVAAQPAGTTQDPATGISAEDLFITAEASTTSVREGEPFVVEYRIWTRVDVTNFGLTTVPEPEGFWVEDLTPGGPPEVDQRVRNGAQYATAMIRRVALVPTGSGRRTIDPIGVEAQVRVRRGTDAFESFFGRSSLFGTTNVPATVLSNPLTVDVSPLPTPRPDRFTGMVGSLAVSASLDRDSVDASEAVTLTVRVSGEGNIRTLPAPELDLPSDFEVFPPEVSEEVRAVAGGLAGARTFEYVLIPRAPGRREIPAVEMAYFDADAGEYRTAASAPLPLTVSGEVPAGPAAIARGGVSQLREDIRFIRLGGLELRRTTGGPVFGRPGFWLLFLLPMVAVAGAGGVRRHQDQLAGDVAYARGRKAGRVAKRRLAEARRLAAGDDARAFHAEVARALRGFVADRLNLAEAGLLTNQVDDALARRGIPTDVRTELRECLDHCDRQRFAPPGSEAGERARFLERVEGLMGSLDRGLR